jgi:signal transduction histidine kinase/CheY-like chemotaxis protein
MDLQERRDGSGADFLVGGGEMGQRMRDKDWSGSLFGPIESWPASLKTSISMMLASRFAMVIAWGPAFRFFYNDRYRPVLGATKHPGALGTPAQQIFPEAWPFIGPLFESTRAGESVALDDVLIPLERYGYLENCYFTLSYSPIRDESGGVGGMLAVVAETTERVQGERRLKTLRDLARRAADDRSPEQALLNAADSLSENPTDVPFALLYLVNDQGTAAIRVASTGIATSSAAAPAVLDLTAPDHQGWPVEGILEERHVRVVDDLPQRFGSLPGGPYPEATHTAVIAPLARPGQPRPDGFVIFGVSPRRALDDSYRGFYDLAADHILTGIRNAVAYREERKRLEALAEIDRAKTAFFSNVSHEFRTPLSLMLGPLEELLAPNSTIPHQAREQLDVAYRNSLRLLKLVNTVLDFSRIEAERAEANYEPVELGAFTAELASVFRSTMAKAGLRFVVDCPPLAQPAYIDRGMWEKIVFNLLSNAFKFTFEGSIAIRLREVEGKAQLVVEDTGTGIPAEELPHLWERFHRVKGAKGRTYEGTGIGLALVRELVRLHGGTVSAASEVDRGSTFLINVPLGRSHLPAERVRESREPSSAAIPGNAYVEEALRWLPRSHPAGAAAAAAQPAREPTPLILLADDNSDMRGYVERLLSDRYRVIAVPDGEAALAAARRDKPDLIISDIMMPQLDGLGLLEQVRRSPGLNTIPVILLSARAGEEAHVEGLSAGADDYMIKPFSARELLARVDTRLEMTKLRRQVELTVRENEERERLRAAELEVEREILETVNRTSQMLSGKLDLQNLVQSLTDAATGITGAQFGSFFYNVIDERGASYMLYTLSGVSPEHFTHFPMPRSTELFGPTFRGEGIVRIDDVKKDPRYGKKSPYYGMPKGHLAVTSYLAVPVISRSGEVLGGLFFGHSRPAAFSERHERIVEGLAGQAAIAIDNARLFDAAQKAKLEAELANRLKDEFLATVSHELRTPLNAMLGWTRLLRTGKLDETKQRQALETVERNAVAQQQIIEDILDVSRIITGKLRLDLSPVDLAVVVAEAADSIRPSADAKGVRLQSIIDSAPNLVLGDANRLQQIIWNLLSNAVKFTPRAGRVQIVLERIDAHVEITVRDTGKGITKEFLPFVFERFRQADSSSTRQFGGLGLGLAIVRHLTELHGGTVHAASPGDGQGATFTVRFPFASIPGAAELEKSAAQLRIRDEAAALSDYGLSLEGVKVLAVDDEADARELMTVVLTQCRASVKAVPSVQEALEIVEQWKPDVLISDIGMPADQGYSMIRQIRALPKDRGGSLPAAALTAYARSDDRGKALAAGYQTYVSKPIKPSELIAAIASLAGQRYNQTRSSDSN